MCVEYECTCTTMLRLQAVIHPYTVSNFCNIGTGGDKNVLQEVKSKLVSQSSCLYKWGYKIDSTKVCFGNGYVGACQVQKSSFFQKMMFWKLASSILLLTKQTIKNRIYTSCIEPILRAAQPSYYICVVGRLRWSPCMQKG